MLFNSFEFMFIFLPVTLAGYYLIAKTSTFPTFRLIWLAAASLSFYGYWQPRFLIVIAVSIIGNYGFATVMSLKERGPGFRKLVLTIAVVANLAAIAFYKYVNFGIDILNQMRCEPLSRVVSAIDLPLGISFFTFTQIAYLVDVYQGHMRERNFVKYFLFVTYFPHLIAGPILHHKEMMPQFGNPTNGKLPADRIAMGLTIFVIGLFKKAVIADGFSMISNPVFKAATDGALRTSDAWAGALAYTVQIYYDFSGYSDMAIGLSLLFGIVLPFNFDSPYKARSIIDFWRRWHITLSRFLRDYLYFPLGGNRQGYHRRYLNLLITMLLGGLWHGAGWTFIAWGGLHGIYSGINHGWRATCKNSLFLSRFVNSLPYALVALALTQLCVVVAWVYFRADSTHTASHLVSAMTGKGEGVFNARAPLVSTFELTLIGVAYTACLVLPNVNDMFGRYGVGLITYRGTDTWSIVSLEWTPNAFWSGLTACTLFVSLFAILIAGDGTSFLYFQF